MEPVHVSNQQIVTNGDMSGNITSLSTNIDEVVSYCVQATFTGSPVGSIKVQASNDPTLLGYGDVTESIASVTGAGTYILNVEFPSYSYVQLVYTSSSGSGTMNAKLNTKRR